VARGRSKRLESIRTVNRGGRPRITERMEDCLEVILELVEFKGYATTIDVSRYMSVSAPSATGMIRRLDAMGLLRHEKYRGIDLTPQGRRLAEGIRQKHGTLVEFFGMLGIDARTANADAEGAEHHLNPKTARRLRKFVTYLRANPRVVRDFRRS